MNIYRYVATLTDTATHTTQRIVLGSIRAKSKARAYQKAIRAALKGTAGETVEGLTICSRISA